SFEKTDPKTKATGLEYYRVSPFHNAMMVRNPLIPHEAPTRPKWEGLTKFNEGEEYSLLKNPKPWTLLVKEYIGGARVLQSQGASDHSVMGMLGLGTSNASDTLGAAALQARELAKFLSHPRFGFKTWVLHTKTSSAVFVGGFDSAEDPE